MEGKRQRKNRSDRDKVRVKDRDISVLRWVGEQYAADFEQVKTLAERYSGKSYSDGNILALIARWRKAGWIEEEMVWARKPKWIRLTNEGLVAFGFDYSSKPPALSRYWHYWYVNEFRLSVEEKQGDKIKWRSERELRYKQGAVKPQHYVDGEIIMLDQDLTIAVELERTQKNYIRFQEILTWLANNYQMIYYVCPPDVYGGVKNGIERFEREQPRSYEGGTSSTFKVVKINRTP